MNNIMTIKKDPEVCGSCGENVNDCECPNGPIRD